MRKEDLSGKGMGTGGACKAAETGTCHVVRSALGLESIHVCSCMRSRSKGGGTVLGGGRATVTRKGRSLVGRTFRS